MSVYLWRCLDIITATDVNPANCVTVAGTFFGGELVAVCLAYVLTAKSKSNTETEYKDNSSNISNDDGATI